MEFLQNNAVNIFVALLVAWMLWQRVLAPKLAGVKRVSASDYMQMRNTPHTLVDVREDNEWKRGHAAPAIHIPLGQIGKQMDRIPRDKPVVLICASGMRSGQAATAMAKAGFKDVYNFSGGTGA